MLLTEVTNYIKCNKIYNLKKTNKYFNYLFTNSKKIKKNSIFVILKTNIKKDYIDEAIERGAVAILTNQNIKNIGVTQFIVKNVEESLDVLLKTLKPFKPLKTIAVTGTNGKTSVVWYIAQFFILNNLFIKSFGTLGYYINNKKRNVSDLTTPEFEVLQQTAFSKKKNLFNYVFEASSHGIYQDRLKNFPVNIAAITNLSQDHLDFHKKFENYRKAKFDLFIKYLQLDGFAVLNDKVKGINKLKIKLKEKKIVTYGTLKSNINLLFKDNKLQLKFFKKIFFIKIKYFSKIELENLSCAIACCFCANMEIGDILKNLHKITNPPGRLELVDKNINKFRIFVDYAHTPDALKKVLIDLKIKKQKPNLVFGCGGNRDKNKRSKMGLIANIFANKVYVTDDNPRNENASNIRKSILSKCKKGIEIPDRKKAIKLAIKNLKEKETLIIAGKGHEKKQINKSSKIKFDDLIIAKNEIKKKLSK